MPNYTIYINTANEIMFKDEPGKSPLVNRLLREYYAGGKETAKKAVTPSIPQSTPVKVETDDVITERKPSYGSVESAHRAVCKIHGTPLDSRGKCLQKGCKYA